MSKKESLLLAPDAPTATFIQEYNDASGNVKKVLGAMVPLYCPPQVLDFLFQKFCQTKRGGEAFIELINRGGPITMDDKLRILGSYADGRAELAKYKKPSDLYLRDDSLKPLMVKEYYLRDDGIAGLDDGPSETVTTSKITENASAGIAAFLSSLAGTN